MTNLNGLLLLAYLLYANVALAGAALFYWATSLAERYNAWTTRIRQRFPNINERPSPNNAQLNVKIIAIFNRVCGAFLVVDAAYYLLHALNRLWR